MGEGDSIKIAFSKVKNDIEFLSNEIKNLKEIILRQNQIVKESLWEVQKLKQELKTPKVEVSTGNDGADQSINQSINQSITNQSINQSQDQETSLNSAFQPVKRTSEVNQSINQSITNQSFDQSINQKNKLLGLTKDISATFLSISKQELKLFLTIYQLEDEGLEPSYKAISLRMQLSEHCIRGHLSSLLKKNVQITKKRTKNRTTLLSVSKEFRALNLKQKLINLYYDSDPHQKTLFDL